MSKEHTDATGVEFPPIPEPYPAANPPKKHFPAEDEVAPAAPGPPHPARLDQDPGGGYNSNDTYPQT